MNKNLNKSRWKYFYFAAVLAAIFLSLPCKLFAANSGFFEGDEGTAKVRLIASFDDKNFDKKLLLGFHFKLEENWKIYGKSDSSFTQPPIFDFSGSQNINSSNFEILWPEAKIIKEKILDEEISYPVYENEVVIPVLVEVLDTNKTTPIKVKIDYGICNNICIPVTQNINLDIKAFEEDKTALELINSYIKSDSSNQISSQKSGQENSENDTKLTLLKAIIISFIGGLILNIMPCVLPVLSIKLLSIINHSQSSKAKIRTAYLSTFLGILFCFSLLALIVFALKVAGASVGWGVQFQNPYFLISLVIILTIFVANLIGLFEINGGSSLSNAINKKINKSKAKIDKNKEDSIFHTISTNFLSGILVVLLATPCSAPFLGTAISFAFAQSGMIIFTIFTFMALGLAFPYLILAAFPRTIKLLPKPGNWMLTVKNVMAGFLAATIIWLIFILSGNIGFISSMLVAVLSTIILFFFKLAHKFDLKKSSKVIIILLISALTLFLPIKISKNFAMAERIHSQLWQDFEEEKIAPYVDQGKIVVIDITADWCISCKANKKLVLESNEVVAKLMEKNIVGMRGNLTKPNKKIMEFMARHNRYGIPFNIVYGPGAKNGILLSEFLNKNALLKIIEKAK